MLRSSSGERIQSNSIAEVSGGGLGASNVRSRLCVRTKMDIETKKFQNLTEEYLGFLNNTQESYKNLLKFLKCIS